MAIGGRKQSERWPLLEGNSRKGGHCWKETVGKVAIAGRKQSEKWPLLGGNTRKGGHCWKETVGKVATAGRKQSEKWSLLGGNSYLLGNNMHDGYLALFFWINYVKNVDKNLNNSTNGTLRIFMGNSLMAFFLPSVSALWTIIIIIIIINSVFYS